jgi:uncharacterized protein (TIGR01777 family)
MSKIIIAGGDGFLGSKLSAHLHHKGHEIIILSRHKSGKQHKYQYVNWDGKTLGVWADELNGCEAVINLSGRSLNTSFTEKHKKEILDSRINTTNIIGQAIANADTPPKTWINGSAVGIYGSRNDEKLTEETKAGHGFIAEVCQKWEQSLFETHVPNTRKVAIRTALVLDNKEGFLKPLITLTKLGMGGKAGTGKQFMPWVHVNDWVRLVDFMLFSSNLSGPVNAVASNAVTNKDFMKALRKTLNIPIGIPQPAILIQLGGKIIGTEAELILTGQNAYPQNALQQGFVFEHQHIQETLNHLFQQS